MIGRVLIVAGSDSSGGAGIQADIKTVTALGGYAMTAVTAVTVQNTQGVSAVHQVPPEVVAGQIAAVLDDIGADVIKVGMIGDMATAETIRKAVAANPDIPLALDPVLVATSGDELASEGVAGFIRQALVPLASVVTPNLPEAEVLTGIKINGPQSRADAANALLRIGADAVLIKGGHDTGETVEDELFLGGRREVFSASRIRTRNTHGTGCTLASAVATGLAQGLEITEAVARAIRYVQEAIRTAPGFGAGAGPLNHGHTMK